MNRFQELKNNEKDIFNVKIKFGYFLKYYIKNFLLNTVIKKNFEYSNFIILILTKEELKKFEYSLINGLISEYGLCRNGYELDNEYSLYLFHKNYSSSNFNENKDFYLNFFQQVKFLFSQKNLVGEKQILLKIFGYNSIVTVFKFIFNHTHLVGIYSYLEYNKYMKLIIKQYDEINKLLRHFIDMNEEDFEREMKMLYDICYGFDITKLYYSLFFDVNIDFMKEGSFNLFYLPHQDIESTLKEYDFKDKGLEFFYLSMYLYFDKIKIFNEHYGKHFREIGDEEKLYDFYCICQVLDEQVKLGKRNMN